MQYLWSSLLLVCTRQNGSATAQPPLSAVAIVQGEQDLHKVVPYRIFWYWPAVSLCLFDNAGQVSTPTILHKNIQDPRLPVNVSVVIAYNVFVMEVLEDVAVADGAAVWSGGQRQGDKTLTLQQRSVCGHVLTCAQS